MISERRERREDLARRNLELSLARSEMYASKVPELFAFLSDNFQAKTAIKVGNFKDWPSVSCLGPEQFTRASLNDLPAKFKIRRCLTVTFTDTGFTVTVGTWRKIVQGKEITERTYEVDEDITRCLGDRIVLGNVLESVKKHEVLSPIGQRIDFEPISQKAEVLLS